MEKKVFMLVRLPQQKYYRTIPNFSGFQQQIFISSHNLQVHRGGLTYSARLRFWSDLTSPLLGLRLERQELPGAGSSWSRWQEYKQPSQPTQTYACITFVAFH